MLLSVKCVRDLADPKGRIELSIFFSKWPSFKVKDSSSDSWCKDPTRLAGRKMVSCFRCGSAGAIDARSSLSCRDDDLITRAETFSQGDKWGIASFKERTWRKMRRAMSKNLTRLMRTQYRGTDVMTQSDFLSKQDLKSGSWKRAWTRRAHRRAYFEEVKRRPGIKDSKRKVGLCQNFECSATRRNRRETCIKATVCVSVRGLSPPHLTSTDNG